MKPWHVAIAAVTLLLALAGVTWVDEGNSSPDNDFFGFWRVIGAARAPWAVARGLKNGEAPLIGWTIEFHDDDLRGPPSLGCKPARYSGGQTAISDLFGRRLDRDRYVEQGSVLGFMGWAETEHVQCGDGSVRDYYRTHGGDLLIAVGGVIYRLRAPEGDPRTFKAGDTAPGFDCVTADNAARQVICLDLKLSALDRKMADGFRRLEAAETPASFATLRAAQHSWFASIVRRCDAGGALPDHADDVASIRDCLADLYPERTDLFDNAVVMKAGGYVLEPRMRFAMRDKPLFADTDCYPWMTGGTAADAFNAYVAKALAEDAQRIDPDHLYVPPNLPPGTALTARRSYRVMRLDKRLVSLKIRTNDYTGGDHFHRHEFSINWDLAKGKPIGFADLFPLNKNGLQFATDFAMKDLARQFGGAPPPRQDDVAVVVADPRDWLFIADAAVVHFPVYSVGNYSQGAFDVTIPLAALQEYLMPDAAPLARK
jgi:uncharacterized protein YecT (DUF1311 family)